MFHTARTDSPSRSLATGRWTVAAALCGVLWGSAAFAQMVPYPEHALRQNTGSGTYTSVRISLNQADGSSEARGRGLSLRDPGFWPHWEGRVGVVVDRQVNPLKDSFVLAQPNQGGNPRVRSLHILSDYYLDGGFRATAGLLRGETGQAWWSSEGQGGGLNLSLQRLDTLGAAIGHGAAEQQTTPYVGAGYSNTLGAQGTPNTWRFNADLGLVSVNANTMNRINQILLGDRGVEDLVRDLRLRPVVKVSVGYSF
jgi:hypothetical protein